MNHSLWRWLDVLALSAVSTSITWLGLPHVESLTPVPGLEQANPYITSVLLIPLVTSLLLPLVRTGSLRFWKCEGRWCPACLRYPSFLWGVPITLLLLWLTDYLTGHHRVHIALPCWVLGVMAVWTIIHIVFDAWVMWRGRGKDATDKRSAGKSGSVNGSSDEAAALDKWLWSDEPADKDLFNVKHLVDRLVWSLRVHHDLTVGIIGVPGSGKSSIISWALKRLKRIERHVPGPFTIVVRGGSWGVKLDSLPEYLLGLAVAEMSKYVDTLALNRLAREYAESVMRSGPSWLHPFAARQASPVEELDKLNRVLEAIDAHLLFVIEDVDRNAPPDDLPTASTQLQSLLDRLRPCKRLSFILAVGNATLDFDRLCDVKIYVPYLPAKMICDTVNKYGSQWMKEAKNDGIHIDSDMGRLFADSSMIRITGLDRDIRLGTDDISLVGLLRTPRRLKAVLNDTKRSWKTLRGEVDFKQLLALATIRAAAPHVVDALHDVRARNHDMSVSQLKAYLDWRDQQIEQAIQRADLEDRDHLNVLAKIFLPRDDPNVFQDVNQDRNQKGDVYWRRIWMGSWVEARGTPRDQDVLSVIKQWKEGKEKEGNVRKLAERLTTDAPFAAVFERLMSSSKLPPIFKVEDQEIWSLVVALKEVVVDRNGQDAAWEDNYTVKSMCDLGLRIVSDNEVNRLLNEEKNRLGLILTKKLQNQNEAVPENKKAPIPAS